ncbi:MAG: hypothetical protein NTX72_04180 [Candidatus Uhrbacteria bacterium]|nr:hypothetical protein [Candidatus Uhrbacteria bacterium]
MKTKEYFGPPIDHPGQHLKATWHGKLDQQSNDIQQGIHMLRTGWDWSRAPLPDTLEFKFDDNMTVKGAPFEGYSSFSRPENKIRFVIAEWDERILRFYFIEIAGNDVKVDVRENPPDPRRDVHFPAP